MENEEIKEWLSASGHSREWLADQCGVSFTTVNGWLSANRTIPGPALRLIDRLRKGSPELNPTVTVSELLAAQQKAKSEGKSLDEWVAELIRKEINQAPKSSSSEGK